jgi:hypothetical protein
MAVAIHPAADAPVAPSAIPAPVLTPATVTVATPVTMAVTTPVTMTVTAIVALRFRGTARDGDTERAHRSEGDGGGDDKLQ